MIVSVLEFVLCGFNQDFGHGGIKTAIGVTNSIRRLTITFVRHDTDNNGLDLSAIRGDANNILVRGRGRGGRGFCW